MSGCPILGRRRFEYDQLRSYLPDQGVDDPDAGKAGEVTVGRPKFADAVCPADGEDFGVMNGRTGDAAGFQGTLQFVPVAAGFSDDVEGRGFKPTLDGVNGVAKGSGRTGRLWDGSRCRETHGCKAMESPKASRFRRAPSETGRPVRATRNPRDARKQEYSSQLQSSAAAFIDERPDRFPVVN